MHVPGRRGVSQYCAWDMPHVQPKLPETSGAMSSSSRKVAVSAESGDEVQDESERKKQEWERGEHRIGETPFQRANQISHYIRQPAGIYEL